MDKKSMQIQELHLVYQNWLNKISFYQQELKLLNSSSLEALDSRKLNGLTDELEELQKKMNNQTRKISLITHNVKTKQDLLTQFPKEHIIDSDDILYEDHLSLKDEFVKIESLFLESKKEFTDYLLKLLISK